MSKTPNNFNQEINSDSPQGLSNQIQATNGTSELMTEAELIQFLRVPEVSKSQDYHNVIENLKRMHDLPRVHICGKPLYPLEAIKGWIKEKTINGK